MLIIRHAQRQVLDERVQASTRARVHAALRQRQPATCDNLGEQALQGLVRRALRDASSRGIAYEPDIIELAQGLLRVTADASCTS